jgi:hypothetical protein
VTTSRSSADYEPTPNDPPRPSNGVLSDLGRFLLSKPAVPTLVRFDSEGEREEYSHRMLQRVGVNVTDYSVLNIHRIVIECPVSSVFEELLEWDEDSIWWPNHLATAKRVDGKIDHLHIVPFGRGFCKSAGFRLFELVARKILDPDPAGLDNARYLLYECRGGYPIGIFAIYARSPIAHLDEKEQTQMFFAVSFDFYEKKNWSRLHPIHSTWETVHNRATANIMNRFKQLQESKFRKYRKGD